MLNEKLIGEIKSVPILVAGDVMVDEYVVGDVDRISPESPVPVLVSRDVLRRLGGAGNVVANLVSLGSGVALLAAVGTDDAGKWFKGRCEELGVETFWLKQTESRPTTIKTRVVARNQQIVRIDQESLNQLDPDTGELVVRDADSLLAQVKAVILSDYGKGFLTGEVIAKIINGAKRRNVPVLVDPKGLDFEKYRGCSYLTPNIREASAASGIEIRDETSLAQAGRRIIEKTEAKGVIVTKGRAGSSLITGERVAHFPVEPVEIIDVTGAGDTVIAALGVALGNDLNIDEAISMANLAGSLVVSRFGAAAVTLKEMAECLSERDRNGKIFDLKDIASVLRSDRIQGKKIVFSNGCFDLLHAGHLHTLRQASKLGDTLVVGVNSDISVKSIKGPHRPIIGESQRMELLAALDMVDYVIAFDEDTPLRLIKEVAPDILVKGEDWRGKEVVGAEIVQTKGGRVEFVELKPGCSTSLIIDRIKYGL